MIGWRLSAKSILEIAGGVVLFVLGVLFVVYIQPSPSNLASDAIFLGAGVLITRKGIKDRAVRSIEPSSKGIATAKSTKTQALTERQGKQKQAQSARRRLKDERQKTYQPNSKNKNQNH